MKVVPAAHIYVHILQDQHIGHKGSKNTYTQTRLQNQNSNSESYIKHTMRERN